MDAKQTKVVIIDTGCANVSSVRFAIERLGYQVQVTDDRADILSADKLFLPGVGTASEAMKNLDDRNLIALIKEVKQPILGICLGMQLLAELSEENIQGKTSNVPCLGICDAHVLKLDTKGLPLPHMGWNTVKVIDNHPLFNGIAEDSYFYFVHSYGIPAGDYTIGETTYGQGFSAAIQVGNFYGVQFHPERSSKVGAKLIENFLAL